LSNYRTDIGNEFATGIGRPARSHDRDVIVYVTAGCPASTDHASSYIGLACIPPITPDHTNGLHGQLNAKQSWYCVFEQIPKQFGKGGMANRRCHL